MFEGSLEEVGANSGEVLHRREVVGRSPHGAGFEYVANARRESVDARQHLVRDAGNWELVELPERRGVRSETFRAQRSGELHHELRTATGGLERRVDESVVGFDAQLRGEDLSNTIAFE